MMHKTLWMIWSGLLLVALVASRGQAVERFTWEFDDPEDYRFDPTFVEVAEGQGRLVLQSQAKGEASLEEYTNAPAFSGLSIDLPAAVRMVKDGSFYPASVTLQSPVLDAGPLLNQWQRITIAAGFERYISDASVIGYYPFEGSLINEAGLPNPIQSGAITYDADAAVGNTSMRINTISGYVRPFESNPLFGQSAFTVATWFKASLYRNYAGLIAALDVSPSTYLGIRQDVVGLRSFVIFISMSTGAFSTMLNFPLDEWHHIALTYDGATGGDGRLRVYFDGIVVRTLGPVFGTVNTRGPIYIGNEATSFAQRTWPGNIDDTYILNRALSTVEMEELYAGNSALTKPVRVKIRSSPDAAAITNRPFAGDAGTESSFYSVGTFTLGQGPSFVATDRYAQYQVDMFSDRTRLLAPVFQGIRLEGSAVDVVDAHHHELAARQELTNGTSSLLPLENTTAFLGLARRGNGGFHTNGFYYSRMFDAGLPAQWEQLSWDTGASIDDQTEGLLTVFRMDQSWNASSGPYTPQNMGAAAYSSIARAGTASGLFNGVNNVVSGFNTIPNVLAIEFWIESLSPSNPVIRLSPSVSVDIIENELRVQGLAQSRRTIYLNGSRSRSLLPGWNHVAITLLDPLNVSGLVVGEGGVGGRFLGKLDELGFYSRRLASGEIVSRWSAGQGNFAGRVQFQVLNEETGGFVGPGGLASTFFQLSPFLDSPNLLGQVPVQQRLQYRVLLEGDGNASPMLQWVRLRGTSAGGSFEYLDSESADFKQGTFTERRSALYGDLLTQEDRRSLGARVTSRSAALLLGAWFFDDISWSTGQRPVNAEQGLPGAPIGNAKTLPGGAVGPRYGDFSGGYVNLLASSLAAEDKDFSIGMWFKSTASTASTLVSTDDGARYFALRLNTADGITDAPGAVTFAINDTLGEISATVYDRGLNDGFWHHVMGVRNGRQLLTYVDGKLLSAREAASLGFAAVTPQLIVAKHPSLEQRFVGGLDDLLFFRRALSAGEIGSIVAHAGVTSVTGEYVSAVAQMPDPSIWERIFWVPEGPYGRALSVPLDDPALVGLWQFNETSGAVVNQTTVAGLNGTAISAVRGQPGRFELAIDLPASGSGYVEVPHQAALSPATERISVEAWIYPRRSNNLAIVDKRSGGNGYALVLDAEGLPTFWVGGAIAKASVGIRNITWTHIAGVYLGTRLDLYVNGELIASAPAGTGSMATTVPLWFGRGRGGESNFDGRLDQIAIHNRTLGRIEVLDRYTAGVVSMKFQGRSGTNETITTPFVGPGASTNTFYTDFTGSLMQGDIPLNTHFQYRALMTTEDHRFLPRLYSVQVDASGYPLRAPTIEPVRGFGLDFLGNLITFNHSITANPNTDVRYQLTADDAEEPTWYYWNATEGVWTPNNPAVESYPLQANSLLEVRSNLAKLYTDIYNATGGVLRFRAFLKSDGENRTEINSITADAASGRIVILQPNGQEVGDLTYLARVPEEILWISTNVTGTVKVDFSTDGGRNWLVVNDPAAPATAVPVGAGVVLWDTPSTLSTQVLVRVTNNQDPTIFDLSDAAFSLQQGVKIDENNGGVTWYLGETNRIVWKRSFLGNPVHLDFYPDTVSSNYVRLTAATLGTAAVNTFDWVTPFTNALLVSEQGRLRASETRPVNPFSDFSDNTFVMAGASFTRPSLALGVRKDATLNVQWISAGMGPEVVLEVQEAPGAAWTLIDSNVVNVSGINTYPWLVTNTPTETARLRLSSYSDSRARGLSSQFKIAAIQITRPTGNPDLSQSEVWLQGTTQTVSWIAAGASTNVHLDFSADGGGSWTSIVSNYPNINGMGVTNFYSWTVAQRPSSAVRLRIRDLERPEDLFSVSPYDFQIAGLRVIRPNGGEDWPKGTTDSIIWEENAVGLLGRVEFSYDGGVSWQTVSAGPILANTIEFYTPTNPTVRALARVTSEDPTARFPGLSDRSDALFNVAGIRIETPTQNSRFTIGELSPITFLAAATRDSDNSAPIYYASDGINFDFANPLNTVGDVFSENYPGRHTFNWRVESTRQPSRNARIAVEAGSFFEISEPFVVRGIVFTKPAPGEIMPPGVTSIEWAAAGLAADAQARILLSTNGNQDAAFTRVLGSGFFVNDNTIPWTVPLGLGPTTNAYLKMEVTAAGDPLDVGFSSKSERFVLQGIRTVAPAAAQLVDHGSTRQITWDAAAAGNLVDILYSANGGVTFDSLPVATFVSSADGINSFTWNVDLARDPSTNAVLRVVSQQFSGIYGDSAPFVLRGVKITRPRATDIYATTDAVNTLSWIAVNAQGSGRYDVFYTVAGGPRQTITTGTAASSLNWSPIPPGAVADDVRIVVTDGLFSGTSAVFRVVSAPTVDVAAPAPGDYWKVGTTRQIEWLRGGSMSNSFTVSYSPAPFVDEFVIASNLSGAPQGGPITFNPALNTFSTSWTLPDRLGRTRIIVRNNVTPAIQKTSADFYIVGQLRVLSPSVGSVTFALKPNTPFVWETLGSIPLVDLYYSVSQRHEAESWVKINSAPLANNFKTYVASDPNPWVQRTFPWTVLNARTSLARVRVQESAYTNRFDSGFDGPFADSVGDFTVRYYRVFWRVFDQANGQPLDRIAVVDSSGWSASALDSNTGISNEYPWGTFSTEFYREGFFDASVLFWQSENTAISVPGPGVWTQQVAMARSQISEEYRVLANFSYDPLAKAFTIHSWMERGGIILDTPTSSTVRIFDEQGNAIAVLNNNAPQPNGVFWTVWDASALDNASVYFAKVEVLFSGFVYSSGLTFTLTAPLSADIGEVLAEVAAGLTNFVSTGVGELAANIQGLRDSTEQGFTNLLSASQYQTNLLTQLRDDVANVSTQILEVLGPQLTALQTNLTVLQGLTEESVARILSRPDAVALGSTNTVLYKSLQGYDPGEVTLSVFQQGGGQVAGPIALSHVVGGIYEASYVASWGINTYRLTVTDPIATDSHVMRVVAQDIYETPTLLAGVSTDLLNLEEQITALQEVTLTITNQLEPLVLRITDAVGSFSNQVELLAGLDSLGEDVSRLTNAIAGINTITNIQSLVGQLTNALAGADWGDIIAIRTNLNLLSRDVGGITNTLTALSELGEIAEQIGAVSNAVGSLASLTNVVGELGDLNRQLAVVDFEKLMNDMSETTNILSTLDSLQAISESVGSLSNALIGISGVTNVIGTVDALGVSLLGIDFRILSSNVQSTAAGIAGLTGIAAISEQIGNLSNTVSTLANLTNLTTQVDAMALILAEADFMTLAADLRAITQSVAVIDWNVITEIQRSTAATTNLLVDLTGLTNLADRVAGITNAVGDLAGITNIATQLDLLSARLEAVDLDSILFNTQDMTNLLRNLPGFEQLTNALGGLTGALGDLTALTNTASQVDLIADTLLATDFPRIAAGLDRVTNQLGIIDWTDITELQSDVRGLTNALASINNLEATAATLLGLTNAINRLAGVTNIGAQVAALTNALEGVNWSDILSIRSDVASLTNSVRALDPAALTGIVAELSKLTNALAGVAGITNVEGRVEALATALLAVDFTGMQSNLSGLTNLLAPFDWTVIAGLEGNLSNRLETIDWDDVLAIREEIGTITNTLGGITTLPALIDRLGGLTNTIMSLAGVTNIGAQVTALTNALQGVDWQDVLAIKTAVGGITNALGALPELGGIVDQLVGISNLVSGLAGVTNIGGQVAGLTNLLGVASEIGSLASGISFLTNELATTGSGMADTTNRLGQLITDVGSLSQRLQDVNWENVLAVQEELTALADSLGGLTDVDLTSLNAETIANLTSDLVGVASAEGLASIQNLLGSASDGPSQDSFFGRLSQLSTRLEGVGVNASTAASQATAAKSSADDAESAIQALASVFEGGDLGEALGAIPAIQNSIMQARTELQAVPKALETQGVFATLTKAAEAINTLAQSKGFPELLDGRLGAGADGEGAAAGKEMIQTLQTQIQDMRGGMEFLTELMDEQRHQPVVKDQLLAIE